MLDLAKSVRGGRWRIIARHRGITVLLNAADIYVGMVWRVLGASWS